MKKGFYSRLALDGMKKNKRLYLPYLLTCVLMVGMYYILSFLSLSPLVYTMRGGEILGTVMILGSFVLAFFSVLFLFYTNSFLIRRRKKEFGLFNILGMDKHGLSRILLWETIYSTLFSLTVGLFVGIALSKLAELGLINTVQREIHYTFTLSLPSIGRTILIYSILFFLIFLNNLRQVRFSNPIKLVRSENSGEKPPKANWFWGILGILLLGIAYTMAIRIQDPVAALLFFFIAVLLVILATYLIFISTSVLLCRILQKKKNYYYKKAHFVSVSSMSFRMKRNGAGLASICILLTMILVMISSTTCLYIGAEDSLRNQYPRDFSIFAQYEDGKITKERQEHLIEASITPALKKYGTEMKNLLSRTYASVSGMINGETLLLHPDKNASIYLNEVTTFYFIPLEDYNKETGQNLTLRQDEIFVHSKDKLPSRFLVNGQTLLIKENLPEIPECFSFYSTLWKTMLVILPDFDSLATFTDLEFAPQLKEKWELYFDTTLPESEQLRCFDEWRKDLYSINHEGDWPDALSINSYYEDRNDFYSSYGSLFFLGILLSIVFMLSIILMIYYKQISEGYEDQARFSIMQKVGMTKMDIRKSINSQMLTIFYLPILFAILHLCFAFPMIYKLLFLFNLNNISLFILTTTISVLTLIILYAIVYRFTSNAYFTIVSSSENE